MKIKGNCNCHRMDYNPHSGQHRHRYQGHHYHRSRDPSFSSAMLDEIFKSTEDEGGMTAYKNSNSRQENSTLMRNSSYKRVARIERQWDEDPARMNTNEKSMRGRSLKFGVFNAENYEAEATYDKHKEFHLSFQSTMSSAASCSSNYTSDSTSNSSYLSSDAEALHRDSSSIRTAKTQGDSHHVGRGGRAWKWVVGDRDLHGKPSIRDGYFRTSDIPFIPAEHTKMKLKSKSRKDSKKPKHPSSPGRKLARFLNSLFMAAGTKKPKLSSSSSVSDSNSYYSSERKPSSSYSSSSSVQSRSCLSKSSRGSKNRSVTFYPTIVLLNDESRPCGEKCLHRMENPALSLNPPYYPCAHPSTNAYRPPLSSKELKLHIPEEDSLSTAAADKSITGKYQKANSNMDCMVIRDLDKQEEEEEEDDDDASCSSSDLFELENLAAIDMNMYQRELPVYETTHIETNRAIAKGLIV